MMTEREIKEIQSIANSNKTTKDIFEHLAQRQRFRRETNLAKFHQELMNNGAKIIEDEFIEAFKQLEDAGVGSLIKGRGGKPDRFKWSYNLKGVAKAAKGQAPNASDLSMNPGVKRDPLIPKRSPGRPAGALNKVKPIQIVFNVSPEFAQQMIAALKKAV